MKTEKTKLPKTTNRYAIENAKFFEGKCGIGLRADFLVNGVSAANFTDKADGGAYTYVVTDKVHFDIAKQEIEKHMDIDLFMSLLHFAQEGGVI